MEMNVEEWESVAAPRFPIGMDDRYWDFYWEHREVHIAEANPTNPEYYGFPQWEQ